jgi:organic hydroperoxide reductase OsmC/OhrA
MGGSGKPNTHNPEELFGAGYAACYLSALNAVHSNQNKDSKPLPKSTTVDGFVSIGKTDVPVSLNKNALLECRSEGET